jgi:hypothetical protein
LPAREIGLVTLDVEPERAAKLREAVEPAFEHVARKTGLADSGPVELTLVGSSRRFEDLAGSTGIGQTPENVLGFAQPSSRRIVLNLAAIRERGFSEAGVLRHEVGHLVLGANLASPLPLWLEEGLCQWLEAVPLHTLSGGVPGFSSASSLEELSRALRDPNLAGDAYREAQACVQFLVSIRGEEGLRRLLGAMKPAGVVFRAAFEVALGLSLDEFERRWLDERSLSRPSNLLFWLGGNFWWLWAVGAAGLLMAAWAFRRRRHRRMLKEWDERDAQSPPDPEWSYEPEPDLSASLEPTPPPKPARPRAPGTRDDGWELSEDGFAKK